MQKICGFKNIRVLIDGAKSPFELLTGLLRAGPVYKIPSIFSPGVFAGSRRGGVPSGSPNLDTISDL